VVTIQNPRDGKTIEVVKMDDLKAAGVKEPVKKASGNNADYWAKQRAQQEQERIKQEALAATNMAVLAAVRHAAAQAARGMLDMQLIAQVTWAGVSYRDKLTIIELYGAQDREEITERIDTMGPDELGLFMLDCALVENLKSLYIKDKPDAMLTMAKHYGIDVDAVRKAHLAAEKAKPKTPAEPQTEPAADAEEEDLDEEVDA
jgi:hypothetical protein